MSSRSILAVCTLFLLSACGTAPTDTLSGSMLSGATYTGTSMSGKTVFIVDTIRIGGVDAPTTTVEKTGRLTAGSPLSVGAEGMGRVAKILVTEGQSVIKGQIIAQLEDTNNVYGLRVRAAQNAVSMQSVGIQSTEINLSRSIADAKIGYEQAKRTLETLQADTREQKKKVDNDYLNADPTNTGSTAYATVEKIRLDIEKANIDAANISTNLDANYHLYANDIEKIVTAMLYDGDKFLGISDNFKYNNDGYEPQLGATLGTSKSDAENAWRALQASVADLRASAYIVVDEKNAISEAKKVTKVYTDARAYLSLTTTMLQNSLVGGGLSQGMVDGYIAGLNGYRAQVSGGEQGYSAWRNNAVNGLSGISTSLASLQKQLAIAEKNIQNGNFDSTIGYKRSVISMADRLRAAELSLKQAENAYTSAKNGKPISLSQASLSRNSASISLSQAQSEYAKLTLRAPVAGTITRISTDIGAMTNVGTPIYEIASNNAEVVLDLDSTTSRQVRNGDSVYIVGDTQTLTGTVVGISTVANASLQYTTRIAVPDTGKLLGSAVKIQFVLGRNTDIETVGTVSVSLPLSSIQIVSENLGNIAYLVRTPRISGTVSTGNVSEGIYTGNVSTGGVSTGATLRTSEYIPTYILAYTGVTLGKVLGDNIEIKTVLPSGMQIVTSDVSNYDSAKNILKVRK